MAVWSVVKHITIRLIITLALSKRRYIREFDFNNVVLNKDLTEDVFMSQPECFQTGSYSLVCKLHKALYGLNQAPRAWFQKLGSTIHSFGFTNTRSDASLFTKFSASSTLYVLGFVADILITDSDPRKYLPSLNLQILFFAHKYLSQMHFFLGTEVHYSSTGEVLLSQSKYIKDLLHKVGMDLAKPMPNPMVIGKNLTTHGWVRFDKPSLN